jgi:thiamine-phosphate pyrophosphorylase
VGQFINSSVLRLLDANFNRAREALRVLEDYARFIRDDAGLSESLKTLRHDLTAATAPHVAAAIAHRDTPGDVGTMIGTPAEARRDDLAHVVTAAGKRMGEALRAIEEYLKTIDADVSQQVEQIRYRFYAIEQRIAETLRPAACGFAEVRLYVLITESQCKTHWLDAARQAIEGGADCLQLREKDMESGELLRRAKDFVALCREHGVISIINDRPDIAALSDADGVHVGQGDLPIAAVRQLLGRGKIVGVSTHTIEQARAAEEAGADYIGVGPVFPSSTKPRDFLPGLDFARAVAAEIQIFAIAIAGITLENVDEVLATGVKAVAVTAAVVGADDVRAAARDMTRRLSPSSVGQAFLPVSPPASPPALPSLPPGKGTVHRRHLPHYDIGDVTYFLTFRLAGGRLSARERHLVYDHVLRGHGRFYRLFAAVVMPDHVHMLVRPMNDYSLSDIGKGTKGVSAKLVNEHRKQAGQVWQDETFDRVIRDRREFEEKLQYVLHNAMTKGLVDDPWMYPELFILDRKV